jgi:malate dehydrogenase (oxaloacetate-decarboxylating)
MAHHSAAGHAIAATISEEKLAPDYIVPSVFNREVVPAVAAAVARAAEEDGVARRGGEPAAATAAGPQGR